MGLTGALDLGLGWGVLSLRKWYRRGGIFCVKWRKSVLRRMLCKSQEEPGCSAQTWRTVWTRFQCVYVGVSPNIQQAIIGTQPGCPTTQFNSDAVYLEFEVWRAQFYKTVLLLILHSEASFLLGSREGGWASWLPQRPVYIYNIYLFILAAPGLICSTRDQTHVLCTGRWIFNHWMTREVPRGQS